ncbi:quercetin dioxygenase-like cupin family protein [Amycolatopsis lexingtonensis]|uniref:Quercetin dioxygenase-like cupin family protein n=1 Tax=Amycolatopsis lexingtonensis TaxID=218822 RepID=A0ABR9HXY2_9PSEU|nr:hypothetical protein [Amycolatopsis lexingtonensis]MBE1495770.1 quercetin dioxygenase-like cupin family protein [Amycolatopsis lexingtonensis]
MTTHPQVTQVDTVAGELIDEARGHGTRRAARTLITGTMQRATLIALADGAELAEHDSPPAATLYVVTGRVRLHTHDHAWTLERGQLARIPPDRHGLTALADSAVLLTVALH